MALAIQHLRHANAPRGNLMPLIHFLDRELRADKDFSVEHEFPSLFGDYPGGESVYIVENGQIVSHMGYLVREFRGPSYQMKIGILSSLATAERFRGCGYAKLLTTEAIEQLRKRGCLVALLWTEIEEFHRQFGFYRSGRERDFKFSAESVAAFEQVACAFDPKKHGHMVWRLYHKHSVKLDRSLEEQKLLCEIPQSKIFVTQKPDGSISSYLAIQKGADFKNYIHEWGGDLAELSKNIAYVQRNTFRATPLTLIAPDIYDLSPIRVIACEEWKGVLGMMKILNHHALMNLYLTYLRNASISAEWDLNNRVLTLNGEKHELNTDEKWIQLIFGNWEAPQLPFLPFFLWGFDSV